MIERGVIEALHRARAAKDPKAIAQAEALASVLKAVKLDGFQDVATPKTSKETAPAEVKRFTDEAREKLTREGHLIYTIGGQSIATMRDAGRPFWSTWHKDYPEIEALTSTYSEIAINPDPVKFFIPRSNNERLDRQLEMVDDYSNKLSKKVKGVQAVLGQMPDYADLAFSHLDATKDRLFGEKYDYRYTRTQTPTVGTSVACVGGFIADDGLSVGNWAHDVGNSGVFASPLVVPK